MLNVKSLQDNENKKTDEVAKKSSKKKNSINNLNLSNKLEKMNTKKDKEKTVYITCIKDKKQESNENFIYVFV